MDGDTTLDETNFKEFAEKAIAKYAENDMPIDKMLWSCIIGLYNKEIATLQTTIREREKEIEQLESECGNLQGQVDDPEPPEHLINEAFC